MQEYGTAEKKKSNIRGAFAAAHSGTDVTSDERESTNGVVEWRGICIEGCGIWGFEYIVTY